jgi:hypothetical protein
MAQLVVVAMTSVIVSVVLFASLRAAFVALALTLALVSPAVNLPNGLTSQLFVERVVVVAFGLGLILRWRSGHLPRRARVSTPLTAPLVAYAGVALVAGVALASSAVSSSLALSRWVQLVEPLVLFVVVVVAARAINDLQWVSSVIVGAFSVTALIGLGERLTGKRLVSLAPKLFPTVISANLAVRGGEFRPAATFDYPQVLGIVLACVVPLALVTAATAATAKQRWARTLAAVLLAAVSLLTISRSAALILAIGLPLLALFCWHRAVLRLIAIVILAAAVGYIAFPHVRHAFSGPGTAGSAAVRVERVPIVAQQVANRPWTGLGLGGLDASLPATDDQYVRTYGELGVLGLCVAGFLWLAAVAAAGSGLAQTGTNRLWAAAACAGLVMALVAAESIDLFALGTSRTFWVLAAVGVVASERVGSDTRVAARRPDARFGRGKFWAAVGAVSVLGAVGVVVALASPEYHAADYLFETWNGRGAALSLESGFGINEPQEATVCAVVHHVVDSEASVGATCRSPNGAPGTGVIRLSYRDPASLNVVLGRVSSALRGLPGFQLRSLGSRVARPTAERTAPLWLSACAVFLVWVPSVRPRLTEAPV